jgi:hypothetical protein
MEEKKERDGKKESLTKRLGAYLAGMARQCPRGRPDVA